MSRKQNKPQQSPPAKSAPNPMQESTSDADFERRHDAGHMAARESIRRQRQAGNRAALEALEARNQEEEQDTEHHNEAPEKRVETPDESERDLSDNTSKPSGRIVRKRIELSNSAESDWELLLGGEDDEPPAVPSPGLLQPAQQSLRSLPLHSDSAKQAQPAPSRGLNHAPLRPQNEVTGHHRYYALTASLNHPERWINPDQSPESLGCLPPEHPLLRVQTCLEFWFKESASPLSKTLVVRIQNNAQEIGHLERLVQALGFLLLLQELEAQHLGVQKTADITALLLQEKIIHDVEDLESASGTVDSTPNLFLRLLPVRIRGRVSDSSEVFSESEPCRLLSLALMHALPAPAAPPIATPYVPPKQPVDPELEAFEAVYASLWDAHPDTDPFGPLLESAQSLLEACGGRRHWYAAQACALWRCRGDSKAAGLYSVLVDADPTLRSIAIGIHNTLSTLESGAIEKNVLAIHQELLAFRDRLQALDHSIHGSLIMVASRSDPEEPQPSLSLSESPDFLWAELQNDGVAPGSEPSERDLEQLSPTEHLMWAWSRKERGQPTGELHALLQHGDNPWLNMGLALNQGLLHPAQQEMLFPWRDDPVATAVWRACLREVCMDPHGKS